MTPEQMKKISDSFGSDPETAHSVSDQLMCHCLRELGFGEGVVIFQALEKWYT